MQGYRLYYIAADSFPAARPMSAWEMIELAPNASDFTIKDLPFFKCG